MRIWGLRISGGHDETEYELFSSAAACEVRRRALIRLGAVDVESDDAEHTAADATVVESWDAEVKGI